MDFVEHYYTTVLGYYPFETDCNKIKSQKIIDYLIDAGVTESEILSFVEDAPASDCLNKDMLPNWLWEGSLIKRDTFYYHNVLHIVSKPPMWNPRTQKEEVTKFFLEMKIKYTLEDLLNYYYKTFSIELALRDRKKDSGAIQYLLNRYSAIDFIEPLDFILHSIDYIKNLSEDNMITNILEINKCEQEVFSMLQCKTAQAKLSKADKIVWR